MISPDVTPFFRTPLDFLSPFPLGENCSLRYPSIEKGSRGPTLVSYSVFSPLRDPVKVRSLGSPSLMVVSVFLFENPPFFPERDRIRFTLFLQDLLSKSRLFLPP